MKKALKNIISHAERYAQTDVKYVIKNGFWLWFQHGLSLILTFALSVAFARLLSKEAYGNYRLILSFSDLLSGFTLSGIAVAITQSIARGYEGSVYKSFWWQLKGYSLFAAISAALSTYYYLHDNHLLSFGLLITAIAVPLSESFDTPSIYLQGKKLFREFSIMSILRKGIPIIALGILLFFQKNPLYLAAGYMVFNLLAAIPTALYIFKKYKPNKKYDPETKNYIKHSSAINLLAVVADKIDNLLIFHYVGAAPLAVYSFANAMPENINGLFKYVTTLALPKFAAQNNNSKPRIIYKSLILNSVLAVATVAYIVTAPFIYQLFFPKYTDSIFMSQILAIMILLNSFIPVAYLDGRALIKQKYKLAIWSNILKLLALFFGCLYYGIWGVIVARIFAKLFGLIYSTYLANKASQETR